MELRIENVTSGSRIAGLARSTSATALCASEEVILKYNKMLELLVQLVLRRVPARYITARFYSFDAKVLFSAEKELCSLDTNLSCFSVALDFGLAPFKLP